MVKEKVLLKKAKELELKGQQKINFSRASFSTLGILLDDIYVSCLPKLEDYHFRRDLVQSFSMMAKDIYGNHNEFPTVEVFGSFLMDMFSPKSDLDLSVNFSKDSVELSREDKIKALRKFANKLFVLQNNGHVYGVVPIMHAKVPIVKVIDRRTGIECDVSVENKDGIAKSCFVGIISAIDERFQKLSFLMKAWAKAYNINSSKDRTLNSLSIILLVAFHLQTRDPPILPPFSALLKDGTNPENVRRTTQYYLHYGRKNEESLAELFATFLSKLASVETLWPKGLCASTYEGSWINKQWGSKVGPNGGNISVEDFMDRSQNVARSVGAAEVKKIYKCINSSINHLVKFMDYKINAANMKTLLFGAEHGPHHDENGMQNHKRNFPSSNSAVLPPLDPVTKRARTEGGWTREGRSSWAEVDRPWGETKRACTAGRWSREGQSSWAEVDRPWGEIKRACTAGGWSREGQSSWAEVDRLWGETPRFFPPSNPHFLAEQSPFVAPARIIGLQQAPSGFERVPTSQQNCFPYKYGGLNQSLDFERPHVLALPHGINQGPNFNRGFPLLNGIGRGHHLQSYNQITRQDSVVYPYLHG